MTIFNNVSPNVLQHVPPLLCVCATGPLDFPDLSLYMLIEELFELL